MSSQVKSGGGGGIMYMSGYKESQVVSFVSCCSSSSCAVGDDSFSFASFGSYTTIGCSAATMVVLSLSSC
jgi:hypothetical protein